MAEKQFRVIREHVGDKPYAEGDVRMAEPKLVEHLIGKVLEPIEDPAPAARKSPPKRKPTQAASRGTSSQPRRARR